MRRELLYNKFNRGMLDPLALTRDDVEKINSSASDMTNWIPQRLGAMSFRPGFEFIDELVTGSDNVLMVPFVKSLTEQAILSFESDTLHIRNVASDGTITSPPAAEESFTINNGSFNTSLTGWTDASGGSATTGYTSDYGEGAALLGTGSAEAILYQVLTTTDGAVQHVLHVVVREGPAEIRIGTGAVSATDIYEGTLKPGSHYLSFTPGATSVYVTFASNRKYRSVIAQCLNATTPWYFDFGASAYDELDMIDYTTISELQYDQSGDIIYFARAGIPQFQVERRGTYSWSVCPTRIDDGPFGIINDTSITLTPAALSGTTTLTASRAYFESGHVGQLFKLVSAGQERTASVSAEDNGTDSIFVTGVGTSRAFVVGATGTWSGTVTLQRSTDDATWEDVETYTSYTYKTYNDAIDNGLYYYRLHVKTGDYTSGTVSLVMDYPSGSIEGICRVTAITSTTVAKIQVLSDFGATDATRDWYPGQWSALEGYPSAVAFYEGRLWYAGNNQLWGSVSDAYSSFDRSIEGASASIYRTIGFGPTDKVSWLKGTLGFVLAIATDEVSVRSSAYGEILTNTNTNLRPGNNEGAANVMPVRADKSIFYAHRNTAKLYALDFTDVETFTSSDQTKLNPSICSTGIKRIAISRQPETRVWCVLDDGTMSVELVDTAESVIGWSKIDTSSPLKYTNDSEILDAITLPTDGEDRLYVIVKRAKVAGYNRTLERLGKFSEVNNPGECIMFDSCIRIASPGSATIDLSDYEWLYDSGLSLGVWADGQYRGEFAFEPASTDLVLDATYTTITLGLPYTATHKSNKLAGYRQDGIIPYGERARVTHIGIVGQNIWPTTLTYSCDGTNYEALPDIEGGITLSQTNMIGTYDAPVFEFSGNNKSDPRVWLKATGPATIMALKYVIESTENPSA